MQAVYGRSRSIAESSWFQNFIIVVILAAGILVGIQTYGDSVADYEDLLNALDLIVLGIFVVEVVVKMLANGPKFLNYFRDSWNVFDFLIVAVAIVALFFPELNAGFVAVLRLVRILRVFKLVTAIPKLQLLVGALLKSIPSMAYVGLLLSLLFYIYSAMAVFLFGENDPLHFGNLQTSMLSLFRVVTLEDWTDIMYINIYGCDHSIWGYGPEQGCTQPQGFGALGALFFVSFVMVGTMIVLNLFIGVIMNSMDEARAEADQGGKELEVATNGRWTRDSGNGAASGRATSAGHELDEAALSQRLEALSAELEALSAQLAGRRG